MALNSKCIRVEGVVEEALPGLLFRVNIRNERQVLAHLAGRLKMNKIRVIPGDKVTIEMTSAEDERGRIVRRL